jgi:putative transposase
MGTVGRIDQDWDRMITSHAFSREHWTHLRTTNPVESSFAALRLRTAAAKRVREVDNATAVIWQMLLLAERRFRRLNAPELMAEVFQGATYLNGLPVQMQPEAAAA